MRGSRAAQWRRSASRSLRSRTGKFKSDSPVTNAQKNNADDVRAHHAVSVRRVPENTSGAAVAKVDRSLGLIHGLRSTPRFLFTQERGHISSKQTQGNWEVSARRGAERV